MSQMPVIARTAPRAPRRVESARPHLRVVPTAPRRARRLPFVVLCSLVLAAGLLLLLCLNMSLARGSYRLHDLQARSEVLGEQEQARYERLADLESPTSLATKAAALGMVQGVSPAFLRLPDGQVLGVPQKADEAPAATAGDASTPGATEAASGAADATSGDPASSSASSDAASTEKSSALAGDSPRSSATSGAPGSTRSVRSSESSPSSAARQQAGPTSTTGVRSTGE